MFIILASHQIFYFFFIRRARSQNFFFTCRVTWPVKLFMSLRNIESSQEESFPPGQGCHGAAMGISRPSPTFKRRVHIQRKPITVRKCRPEPTNLVNRPGLGGGRARPFLTSITYFDKFVTKLQAESPFAKLSHLLSIFTAKTPSNLYLHHLTKIRERGCKLMKSWSS